MTTHLCPICSSTVELTNDPKWASKCLVSDGHAIQRYQCPQCDCLFGPLEILDHPDVMSTYETMAVDRQETDSTDLELAAFEMINKVGKGGKYLNFGAGKWSKAVAKLRAEGWDVDAYEPCSTARTRSAVGEIPQTKYDGIFSNNVLEHLQDPVQTIRELGLALKPGGLQGHKTPCYVYCYDFSSWHIIYPLGRSLNVLIERSGQELVKKTEDAVVLRKREGMRCDVSIGEVLDKISILRIKKEKIKDPNKLKHIASELATLEDSVRHLDCEQDVKDLCQVNVVLWDTEDEIRLKEKAKAFDKEFIELARRIYFTNDKRFKVKNAINQKFESEIQEQKSYEEYH